MSTHPLTWQPDVLEGFESLVLSLPDAVAAAGEPEGELVATLVRPVARPGSRRAVIYLHGWSDYFFQTHLAEFWSAQGWDFHAVDLRRYGRSWREGQFMGFTVDLDEYADELDAAYAVVAEDHDQIVLMGHSTGGLVAALYADVRPGRFAGVVLNSPWLDLQGTPLLRTLGAPIIKTLGTQRPSAVIPLSDTGFYSRSLLTRHGGEWDYDEAWKSSPDMLIRVGWLRAVLQGHAKVAAGLGIDCPVLVMASGHSNFARRWSEQLKSADIVLDVDQIAKRAVKLGPLVTVGRFEGGVHDLVLSAPPVREQVFALMARWTAGFVPEPD
ncbi:alpha/beta hydrolase [Mariniluteicoccus flavus]